MKSEIDELVRKRESIQRATPAVYLVVAGAALALTVIGAYVFRPHLAAIFACMFAASLVVVLEKKSAKSNLEIIDKLNAMESRLQEVEDSSGRAE